jgi:hypothetical protein
MRDCDFVQAGHAVGWVVAGEVARVLPGSIPTSLAPPPRLPYSRTWVSIYKAHTAAPPPEPNHCPTARVPFLQQLACLRRRISDGACLSVCRLYTSLPLSVILASNRRSLSTSASRQAGECCGQARRISGNAREHASTPCRRPLKPPVPAAVSKTPPK